MILDTPAAIDAAWRCQLRLSGRWAHLVAGRAKRRRRRRRRRARAGVLCLGDRPPARLTNTTNIPFGAGVAAGVRHTGPAMRL